MARKKTVKKAKKESHHVTEHHHKTRKQRSMASFVIGLIVIIVIIASIASMTSQTAKQGDTVVVHYKGTFESGNQFDTSYGKEPLTVTIGSGQVIKGFDEALVGMKPGDKKTITLTSDQAYGERDETKITKVPKDKMPEGVEPKVGLPMIIQVQGSVVPTVITAVDDETVTLDLNHPLAGKTLVFELELVEIKAA